MICIFKNPVFKLFSGFVVVLGQNEYYKYAWYQISWLHYFQIFLKAVSKFQIAHLNHKLQVSKKYILSNTRISKYVWKSEQVKILHIMHQKCVT